MSGEIFNFRRIDERLATAGQPDAEQLRALAVAGCDVVVNLSLDDPRWALPGEAALARELGMEYHHVPVVFDAPARADFDTFAALMDARGDRHTLVHCVANYRVSCFVALYGEKRLGWSRERADALIASVWEPDTVWRAFLADVRAAP